jgi:hypothetical protein
MIDDRVHPIMVSDDAGVRISAYIRERRMLSSMLEPHDMGPVVFIGGHYDQYDQNGYLDSVLPRLLHEENVAYGSGPIVKEKPAENSLVMRLLSRI